MLRHSPAEFYIKYLIVHPSGHDDARVKELLDEVQLDSINEEYIKKLRATCTPPYPFYPSDPLHRPSQRFLMKEKLQGLFSLDESTKRAIDALKSPRVKEFIESMVLSGASSVLIASALTNQKNFACTSLSIDKYKHFFWNIDLVDTTEMRALLALRASQPDENEKYEDRVVKAALYRASFDDPRRVAADLPNAPLVALMSQMRMGFMPRQIDLAKVLEATQKAAAIRALEATLRGAPRDSTRALEFSTVTKMMGEVLETVVKPDERLREELATIALRTEEGGVPIIHELSQGQHTLDLQPKVVTHGPTESRDESPADID